MWDYWDYEKREGFELREEDGIGKTGWEAVEAVRTWLDKDDFVVRILVMAHPDPQIEGVHFVAVALVERPTGMPLHPWFTGERHGKMEAPENGMDRVTFLSQVRWMVNSVTEGGFVKNEPDVYTKLL